jgi:RNA polymerase sigma factor (sigma-70 family)
VGLTSGFSVDRGFDASFERLSRVAYGVARHVLGAVGDAENVAAETMARAQLHWSRIDDHPDGWVVTVATRLAVREARRGQRRFPFVQTASDRDTAEQLVGRIDLTRALARLSRRQRQAIALRYLADLTDAQAADAMGCSVPSFRTHCDRAVRSLRGQLAQYPGWLPVPTEAD